MIAAALLFAVFYLVPDDSRLKYWIDNFFISVLFTVVLLLVSVPPLLLDAWTTAGR